LIVERTVLSNVKVDHEKHFAFIIIIVSSVALSQEDAWVYFNAKSDSQSYFDSPLNMLPKGL
jgi:hypothetical protein